MSDFFELSREEVEQAQREIEAAGLEPSLDLAILQAIGCVSITEK